MICNGDNLDDFSRRGDFLGCVPISKTALAEILV
jgi:hypothetical protein